ncbi:MAG TPA: hypothetical protein VM638_02595, partial [Actinomycetota bacterium]|nr:hypothetical protein [Actinomycetota bacterium]
HLAPEMGGMTAGTFRWRLVYAAPGGAQHQVVTTEAAGQVVAVDRPSVGDYPAPVPPLAEMPSEVVSPAGAVAAWRAIAGPRAWLTGLRWQPLLDDRWYVMGGVEARCGGTPCGTLFMQMPFDHDTGAAGTGEFPLPLPEP